METKDGQTSEQQSEESKPPPPPQIEDIKSTPPHKEASTNDAQKTQTIQTEPTKIIIEEDKRTDKHSVVANIISGFGLVLSVIIFIVTFWLFKQTQISTRAAVQSANAAENTYKEQKINDSIIRVNSQKSSYQDSINTSKRFEIDSISRELQNKSLQSQIQSLKETQKQFEVINKPYLQIRNLVLKNFEVNKKPQIQYEVNNIGQQPAKILTSKLSGYYRTKFSMDKTKFKEENVNSYISKESPYYGICTFEFPLNNNTFNDIVSGKVFMFIFGELKYINLVNKRIYNYKFAIRLYDVTEQIGIDFIQNDN